VLQLCVWYRPALAFNALPMSLKALYLLLLRILPAAVLCMPCTKFVTRSAGHGLVKWSKA
jgi:hypothetical protein